MKLPSNLKYNKDHSWINENKDKVTIGLIKESVDNMGELVFIELPKKGDKLQIGNPYISIESLKWSGHLNSPVTGEVISVNQELEDEPEKINQDPYNNWIIEVKIEKLDELMDNKKAQEYYEEQT